MLNIEKYYSENCFKLPIEFLEKNTYRKTITRRFRIN